MRPSPMAARAASSYSSVAFAFFCLRPLRRAFRPAAVSAGGFSYVHHECRSRLAHSLVDSVLEELRSQRRVRVSAKIGLQGTKELSDNKIDKRTLHKGLLLSLQKDSERSLLAVVERPDGPKDLCQGREERLCLIPTSAHLLRTQLFWSVHGWSFLRRINL